MTVLGFLSWKVHGFQQQYENNGYRTEIRMIDVSNHSWPEVKICHVSTVKDEKRRSDHLYCYNNQTLLNNKISNCTVPANYDITVFSGRSRQIKLKNITDYWYSTTCVRFNLSEHLKDTSDDTAYVNLAIPGVQSNEFEVSVEGDNSVKYKENMGGLPLI